MEKYLICPVLGGKYLNRSLHLYAKYKRLSDVSLLQLIK